MTDVSVSPDPISQHIGWLKQYIAGMTEANWADMRLRAERQLESLSQDYRALLPAPSAWQGTLEWIAKNDCYWTSHPNDNEVLETSITGNVRIRGVYGRRAQAALAQSPPAPAGEREALLMREEAARVIDVHAQEMRNMGITITADGLSAISKVIRALLPDSALSQKAKTP